MEDVKSIGGIYFNVHNGVRYTAGSLFEDPAVALPLVRNLHLRDDDVWMVGFPKSGNHWVLEVLTMVLRQNTEFAEKDFSELVAEYIGTNVQAKLDNLESPRLICSHLQAQNYPNEVCDRKLKIVYIIRNPKDIAVSKYKMWTSFASDEFHFRGSFSEFFDLFVKGEFVHGDWFNHILSMDKFIEERPGHPVYVLVYERMKEDPVSVIRELCAFFDKPDNLAEDIAKATEFSNMKRVLMDGKLGEQHKALMKEDKEGMLRKGIVGDWKNVLTVNQSETLDRVFNDKMAHSHLGKHVMKYI